MNRSARTWKEARRLHAWHLKEQGWAQRQIATALGVSEGAGRQWMKRGREGGFGTPPRPPTSRCPSATDGRPTRSRADPAAAKPRSLWLLRGALDAWTHGRGHSCGIWHLVSSTSRRPLVQSCALESAKTRPPRPPARRSGDYPLARGHLAGHQQGAEAQGQTILFIDESGFYPLPSVVRTYAPVGQTPILREWWTRDHLSVISAISPAGKLYGHRQDHPLNADDVVRFLEHLLREVPGRLVSI